MCLFNMPEIKVLYGGQKCGNGYVEEGEECDCGELEVRALVMEIKCFNLQTSFFFPSQASAISETLFWTVNHS